MRALVCAYFAKNLGDDLFLKILFDRYPDVQWDLSTTNSSYNNIFREYKNVRVLYTQRSLTWWRRIINLRLIIYERFFKYRKYDALIHIGGSIFMESSAWQNNINEREYLLKKFKTNNKKTFILGANFGPFKDDVFLQQYKKHFSFYDDVCFRDDYSYKLFQDLNNVRKASDIVFSLETSEIKRKEKTVGFSIIKLEEREELKSYCGMYYEKMLQLISYYISEGYKIKLFSFCDDEGDTSVIQEIAKKAEENGEIEVISYKGNINSFLKQFRSCGVIIGTRFHSIILALLFGQDVFPIIYNEKSYHVLQDLGLAKNNCFIKDIHNLSIGHVSKTAGKNKIKNRAVVWNANQQFKELDSLFGQGEKRADCIS